MSAAETLPGEAVAAAGDAFDAAAEGIVRDAGVDGLRPAAEPAAEEVRAYPDRAPPVVEDATAVRLGVAAGLGAAAAAAAASIGAELEIDRAALLLPPLLATV